MPSCGRRIPLTDQSQQPFFETPQSPAFPHGSTLGATGHVLARGHHQVTQQLCASMLLDFDVRVQLHAGQADKSDFQPIAMHECVW